MKDVNCLATEAKKSSMHWEQREQDRSPGGSCWAASTPRPAQQDYSCVPLETRVPREGTEGWPRAEPALLSLYSSCAQTLLLLIVVAIRAFRADILIVV